MRLLKFRHVSISRLKFVTVNNFVHSNNDRSSAYIFCQIENLQTNLRCSCVCYFIILMTIPCYIARFIVFIYFRLFPSVLSVNSLKPHYFIRILNKTFFNEKPFLGELFVLKIVKINFTVNISCRPTLLLLY